MSEKNEKLPTHSFDSIQRGLADVGWENLVLALDAHAIIAVTDKRGVITYVNDKFCSISGYDRAELVGLTHKKVNAGFHLPEFWKRFWSTIKKGEIWSGAICNRAKKGNLYWVQTTIYPVKSESGEITAYLALRTEMTRQKEAEARMRETEQRWQFALEGNGDGVWDWNVETGEVYFSNRWKQLVGCEFSEMESRFSELRNRIHPDDWERWHSCLNGPNDRPFEVEHRMLKSDGTYFWSLTRGKVVDWDENGKALRVIGTLRDESERKAAMDRVTESENQFREAFENSRIGNSLVDLGGSFIKVNDALCQMLGYSELELKSMTIREVTHPEDRKLEEIYQEETLSGKRSFYRLQKRYQTREGRTIWANLNVVIARWADGTPRHFVEQVEDITEAVNQREELADLARQADEANRAKSNFLANMSHEIRTPMNGVIGMTSLLLDSEGLSKEQKRQAEIIRSSGQALLGILNDILDFSKVEAGKLELEIVDFDLRDLLDDLSSLVEEQVKQKRLKFRCHVEEDTPNLLRGDSTRLRQIALNLLSNAVKFTNAGSVSIAVKPLEIDETSVTLKISVKDTGIGIQKEAKEQLFNKFMQADSSTTRVYGGTGLGLAICKNLVEMMGGEIAVKSQPGKGSEFWFTAKLQLAKDGAVVEVAKLLDGRSALLVTNSESLLRDLEGRLKSWSVETGNCMRVSTAVRLLRERYESGLKTDYVLFDRREGDEALSLIGNAVAMIHEKHRPSIIVLGGDTGESSSEFTLKRISRTPRQSELFDALLENDDTAGVGDHNFSALAIDRVSQRTGRVLVVEDNVINQVVVLGMLEKFGLSADSVSNGREALEALRNFRYDLVLMDIQMPEIDGLEACRRIRSGEAGAGVSNLPIVGLTAHAQKSDRENCIASGMTDYLSKPVSPRALFEKLDRYLPKEGEPENGSSTEKISESSEQKCFDEGQLNQDSMGDRELAKEIVKAALPRLRVMRSEITEALEAENFDQLERLAHSLKGSASAIGCIQLSDTARSIESLLKAGKTSDLSEYFDRLDEVFAESMEALQQFLRSS